jgi:hypothetical protein
MRYSASTNPAELNHPQPLLDKEGRPCDSLTKRYYSIGRITGNKKRQQLPAFFI